LLVSPKATTGGLEGMRKGHQIHQGLLFVAAAVRAAGHKPVVVIADAITIHRFIRRYKPDVVGFSCVTATYPMARDLIQQVKAAYPEISTVIGGHHVTFMYKEAIEESGVDYVCRGEGEEVFPALLNALEAGESQPRIPGMVFKHEGKFHNDEVIAILEDINTLPRITMDLVAPDFSFTPKIVSSRGCPFFCSYCSISAFYGGKYRQRRVEDVIQDIEDYISWGYNHFWFHDDNLTVDGKWVNSFCEMIESKGLKFTWNCMSRVDLICRDPLLIARMARCGCRMMSIGVESGVPEVLESLHKKISLEQILQAVKIMKGVGISYDWFMLLGSGDHFDTPEIIEKNIKFFSKLPGMILVSILTPFPGTEVYQRLTSEGRIRHYNWEDYDITHCVYNPSGMTYKQMEAYLPLAYRKIYLAKGLGLIPLFIHGIRTKAIRLGMVTSGIKSLLRTYVLGKDFHSAIRKRK
jgi:anaerobic magnesium-protoporphyrin IX monomethyl ester cyclase